MVVLICWGVIGVKVYELMTREIKDIDSKSNIKELLKMFTSENVGTVPVINKNGLLKGVVTQGDMFRFLHPGIPTDAIEFDNFMDAFDKNYLPHRVKETNIEDVDAIMTKKNIITLNPNDYVDEALSLFSKVRFKELPVIDEEGRLVGILSRGDLVKYISSKLIK